VSSVYRTLKSKFELGVDVTLAPMHKDRERDGKELGGRPATPPPQTARGTATEPTRTAVDVAGQ